MTTEIILSFAIGASIGAFIGGAASFGMFWLIERTMKLRKPAKLRDRDGQYMSLSQMQRRQQVHENLRRELAR